MAHPLDGRGRQAPQQDVHRTQDRRARAAEGRARGRGAPERPSTPPEIEPRRFSDAAEYWREHRAPLKRSEKDDLSILKQLDAHFGKLLLNATASWVPAIDRYRAKATQEDKTIANHLILLGSILRLARDLGWVERLPVIKKPRIRLHSGSYSYLRTPEEISRFPQGGARRRRAAATYTGLRAGELAALRWDDIDWSNRLITVQRSYDGPTKAEDLRYVPILDALLRAWRLKHPGHLVFTNRDGNMLQESARIYGG